MRLRQSIEILNIGDLRAIQLPKNTKDSSRKNISEKNLSATEMLSIL